ncbi:MAG: hypothetical protein RPR91_02335, partial [Colwellia sp.]
MNSSDVLKHAYSSGLGIVFVINSDESKIASSCINSRLGESKIILKGLPTFYSDNGKYISPINLWINYLVNVKKYAKIIGT